MNNAQVPGPGWFKDRQNQGFLRWWDGERWTQHVRAIPAAPADPVATPLADAKASAAPTAVRVANASDAAKPRWSRRTLLLAASGITSAITVLLFALVGWVSGGSQNPQAHLLQAAHQIYPRDRFPNSTDAKLARSARLVCDVITEDNGDIGQAISDVQYALDVNQGVDFRDKMARANRFFELAVRANCPKYVPSLPTWLKRENNL